MNSPTCYDLYVIQKLILGVLLWSFVDMNRAVIHVPPPRLRPNKVMFCFPVFMSHIINENAFHGLFGATFSHFSALVGNFAF